MIDYQTLLLALGFSVLVNMLLFVIAFRLRTDALTDLSYSLSFVLLIWYGFFQGVFSFPKLLLMLLISIWALRLGVYLVIRIRKIKRDKRFDGVRESFKKFFRFWILQALTVWTLLLPSLLFFQVEKEAVGAFVLIGAAIFIFGLLFESIADWQKFSFLQKGENVGQWIASGVWKYSRHPNYFGEILVWTGIYIFCLSQLSFGMAVVGLLSPLLITLLLVFRSGIPILERVADTRWGDNPEYQKYKKRTSVLVPWPLKK